MNTIDIEATKGSKVVNGVEVTTFSKEIVSCNILTVEAGTTGFMGGDTGHGGRTYLRITDEASTDMDCCVVDNGEEYNFDYPRQIEIMLGGDCEMETFIEALEFAVQTLKSQSLGQRQLTAKEKKQMDFKSYLEDLIKLYTDTKKLKRGRSTKEEIITELADVHIMVEQMAFFFGWDEFKAEKGRKLERLKSRLENTGKDHSADKHEMVSEDFELFEKQYMNENESEIISVYDRHAGLVDGAKWQREQMKKGAIGTTDYPNDEELWCGFK